METTKTVFGKPHTCGNTERYISNGKCVACARARVPLNIDQKLASVKAWRRRNLVRVRTCNIAYGKKNKTRRNERIAAWRRRNRQKINAYAGIRRARKLSQLCVCCTANAIRSFYESCPAGREVDHVLPLALGGLHCLCNLQILTETAHAEKTRRDLSMIAEHRRAA